MGSRLLSDPKEILEKILKSASLQQPHALSDYLEIRKTLQKAHLSCPKFQECETVEKVVNFAKNHLFPLVIKPSRGKEADLVYTCKDLEELKQKFHHICKKAATALVEEYVNGSKYIINLFCAGKEIHVTDVWVYEQLQKSCWSCILIRPQDVAGIAEYAIETVRAFGIEKGPVHLEIKDDPKRGPTLSDISAKLCGNGIPLLLRESMNFDLYKEIIHVFTDRKVTVPKWIYIYKHFALVFAMGFDEKTLEAIVRLPSYIRHLKASPFVIHLGHKIKSQLLQDIRKIKEKVS